MIVDGASLLCMMYRYLVANVYKPIKSSTYLDICRTQGACCSNILLARRHHLGSQGLEIHQHYDQHGVLGHQCRKLTAECLLAPVSRQVWERSPESMKVKLQYQIQTHADVMTSMLNHRRERKCCRAASPATRKRVQSISHGLNEGIRPKISLQRVVLSSRFLAGSSPASKAASYQYVGILSGLAECIYLFWTDTPTRDMLVSLFPFPWKNQPQGKTENLAQQMLPRFGTRHSRHVATQKTPQSLDYGLSRAIRPARRDALGVDETEMSSGCTCSFHVAADGFLYQFEQQCHSHVLLYK